MIGNKIAVKTTSLGRTKSKVKEDERQEIYIPPEKRQRWLDDNREFIDVRKSFLAFKNNAPFTNCISKISNVLIDNSEDLHAVMPMYNLLEYSRNYRKTTGSFWNYYRDEPNNPPLNDDDPPTVNYHADPLLNTKEVLQENVKCKSRKW